MDSSEPLEELCRRLKASDRGAFEQVFRRLREGLLRYVRSIVESDAAIMDVSPQTVNNHIMRALERLQERIETFEPTRMEP